ncbi:MAG TPA: F0F1 ATP synthase subunit A [Terriglobales bacterium]|nr:F0F1 ATP synthase subunit A [Terriglobales bacterium]
MVEQLWFTELLNRAFGGPVTSALHALRIHPHDPAAPITNYVAMQILVVAALIVFFVLVRARLSVENPGPLQHIVEAAHGFVGSLGREMIGHGHERYLAFLGTLGFYILSCNMIGLIPGFESPTAIPSVPLGCAIVTWVYYQSQGFRSNGLGYVTHFLGPVGDKSIPLVVRVGIAILMFPIEVFSHIARMLSLTVRLFANMFAGDMVTLVFFSLVPIGLPVIFLGLHIGVSFIQTYIFVLLATVYLSEATAHAH